MNTRIASLFFGLLLLFVSSTSFSAELVNINRSDAAGIQQSLIGIGPIKAEAIVAYRKKNGTFKSIDDLQNVKGIGPGLIKKNKRYLSLKKGVVSGDAAKYSSAKKQAKASKSKSGSSAKSSSNAKKSTSKSKTKTSAKSATKSSKSAKVKCKGSNKLVNSKADCSKAKKKSKTSSKAKAKSKSKKKTKAKKKVGTT